MCIDTSFTKRLERFVDYKSSGRRSELRQDITEEREGGKAG